MGMGSELLLEEQELSCGCAGFKGLATPPSHHHSHRKVEEAVDTSLGSWGEGKMFSVFIHETGWGHRRPGVDREAQFWGCRSGEPAEEMEREQS